MVKKRIATALAALGKPKRGAPTRPSGRIITSEQAIERLKDRPASAEISRRAKERGAERVEAADRIASRGGKAGRKVTEAEGSALEPVTGRDPKYVEDVGARGEQVTVGMGDSVQGILKAQETAATRKRAARVVELQKKKDDNDITENQVNELKTYRLQDALAKYRQSGQIGRTASRRRVDPSKKQVDDLMQNGVLFDGATEEQIAQALRNHRRRAALSKQIQSGRPMKRGGLTITKKQQEAAEKARKAAKRTAAKIRRDNIAKGKGIGPPDTRTAAQKRRANIAEGIVRKQSVYHAARGGLMKNKHTDYRAGGLFHKKTK